MTSCLFVFLSLLFWSATWKQNWLYSLLVRFGILSSPRSVIEHAASRFIIGLLCPFKSSQSYSFERPILLTSTSPYMSCNEL